MKKLIVDENNCIGCGMCQAVNSDVFTLNDDGIAMSLKEDYSKLEGTEKEDVDSLIENGCPVGAIKIIEE